MNSTFYLIIFAVLFVLLLIIFLTSKKQQKQLENTLSNLQTLVKAREENASTLQSLASIYYSMHLIDLTNYSLVEYKAQNQVKEVLEADQYKNAVESMVNIMHLTIRDEHLDKALEFTDLKTLAARLKGKKSIYGDFHGKNVGWIRFTFIPTTFDEEKNPTAVIIATQIIDAEKKKEEQLIMESNTDEMTGCFNRRAYEDDLQRYPDIPTEANFVYVGMDINGLKVVNDNLGHEAGDELISGAVYCMKRCLGNYGKIYRIGGDEFVAMIFADERTLKSIQDDFINTMDSWSGKIVDSVSVSCGYVTKREFPNMMVTDMAKIADQRLYEDKKLYYMKKGVDRRGQAAAHTALCNLYTKILKVNLTYDNFNIVNVVDSEIAFSMGYSDRISEWLSNFGKTGQVHPDDLDEYLKNTDINFLKEYFKGNNTSHTIMYRRKYEDGFKHAVMEMIPADDYSDENQSIFLYVKSIEK